MAKTLFRVFLILLPIFLVFGLIRFASHGFVGDFLPPYSAWVGWMASFPDIQGEMSEAITLYNSAIGTDFFAVIGAVAQMIWIVIGTPIRVVSWFFGNFFAV